MLDSISCVITPRVETVASSVLDDNDETGSSHTRQLPSVENQPRKPGCMSLKGRLIVHKLSRFQPTALPIYSYRHISTSAKMSFTKDALIPRAQRLFDGQTQKMDVWSIFT